LIIRFLYDIFNILIPVLIRFLPKVEVCYYYRVRCNLSHNELIPKVLNDPLPAEVQSLKQFSNEDVRITK
jgi:hypothetical protein